MGLNLHLYLYTFYSCLFPSGITDPSGRNLLDKAHLFCLFSFSCFFRKVIVSSISSLSRFLLDQEVLSGKKYQEYLSEEEVLIWICSLLFLCLSEVICAPNKLLFYLSSWTCSLHLDQESSSQVPVSKCICFYRKSQPGSKVFCSILQDLMCLFGSVYSPLEASSEVSTWICSLSF